MRAPGLVLQGPVKTRGQVLLLAGMWFLSTAWVRCALMLLLRSRMGCGIRVRFGFWRGLRSLGLSWTAFGLGSGLRARLRLGSGLLHRSGFALGARLRLWLRPGLLDRSWTSFWASRGGRSRRFGWTAGVSFRRRGWFHSRRGFRSRPGLGGWSRCVCGPGFRARSGPGFMGWSCFRSRPGFGFRSGSGLGGLMLWLGLDRRMRLVGRASCRL